MYYTSLKPIFIVLLPIVVLIIGFSLFEIIVLLINKNKYKYLNKSIAYNRDIPCESDLDVAFFLLCYFSNTSKNKLLGGLIGAYLLKWEKNGYIKIIQDGKKYKIDLGNGTWHKSSTEFRLYSYLQEASLGDNIISEKELKNWCYAFKDELRYWSNNVMNNAINILKSKSIIDRNIKNNYYILSGEKIINDKLIKEYQNLLGLKKFLSDFSNMAEKKYIEVHLWEEYLIFSELLGIADEVSKQFNEIYPKFKHKTKVLNAIPFNKLFENTMITSFKLHLFAYIISAIIIFIEVFLNNISFKIYFITYIIICTYFILYKRLDDYYINKLKIKYQNLKSKIKATITDTNIIYGFGSDPDILEISYEFTIGSITYEGYDIMKMPLFNKKVGNKITIYYNPKNPNKNNTKISLQRHGIKFVIISTMFYLLLVIPIIYIFNH